MLKKKKPKTLTLVCWHFNPHIKFLLQEDLGRRILFRCLILHGEANSNAHAGLGATTAF
jgi:hypothetical protein